MNTSLVVTALVSILVAILVNVVQPHIVARIKQRESGATFNRATDQAIALKQIDVQQENIERLSQDNERLRQRVSDLEAEREGAAQDRIALHRTVLTIGEMKDHLDDMEAEIVALVAKITECVVYPEVAALATDLLHAVRRGKAIGGAA